MKRLFSLCVFSINQLLTQATLREEEFTISLKTLDAQLKEVTKSFMRVRIIIYFDLVNSSDVVWLCLI